MNRTYKHSKNCKKTNSILGNEPVITSIGRDTTFTILRSHFVSVLMTFVFVDDITNLLIISMNPSKIRKHTFVLYVSLLWSRFYCTIISSSLALVKKYFISYNWLYLIEVKWQSHGFLIICYLEISSVWCIQHSGNLFLEKALFTYLTVEMFTIFVFSKIIWNSLLSSYKKRLMGVLKTETGCVLLTTGRLTSVM